MWRGKPKWSKHISGWVWVSRPWECYRGPSYWKKATWYIIFPVCWEGPHYKWLEQNRLWKLEQERDRREEDTENSRRWPEMGWQILRWSSREIQSLGGRAGRASCEGVASQAVSEPQHGKGGLPTEWCWGTGCWNSNGMKCFHKERTAWPFRAWEGSESIYVGRKHNEKVTELKNDEEGSHEGEQPSKVIQSLPEKGKHPKVEAALYKVSKHRWKKRMCIEEEGSL